MPTTNKVVRHSRHEMVKHDGEASAAIEAGRGVVEEAGGTVAPGSDATSRLLVAKDDRERGMVAGDEYELGENVVYLALSGGGVNVLLAGGETLDPSTENRLVQDADGYFTVFDGGAGDEDADVVGFADEDAVIEAPAGEPTLVSMEVA